MHLYLASTSPARLATLRAVGIEPVTVAPGVDEEAAVAAAEAEHGRLDALQTVSLLGRLKAEAVAAQVDDGLVLGGDSAFDLGGVVYGKPHLPERARERWLAQRGQSGVLYSGHTLIDATDGRAESGVASATVRFAEDITDAEIDAYVATGEPLEVAGAFTIDAKGAGFIREIDGDPHAVVGLSVQLLRTLVRRLGHDWPSLWNR
ncbi:Maf family protein [Pseudolysinimonas sp.]|uniref:Maf family protein n=1 Tax=Pseudolysinimonas sp. TaxID=2680009 RepID=UPI003F7DE601